jgi:hypothetical protein
MTEKEHLLILLIEECVEVSQRATKILRFGFNDPTGTEPDQPYNNEERLIQEINDLEAVIDLLFQDKPFYKSPLLQNRKKEKIKKYSELSKKLGLLN